MILFILLLMSSELEQQAALKYLYSWLRHHPEYGKIAPPQLSDSLYYTDVSVLYFVKATLLVGIYLL